MEPATESMLWSIVAVVAVLIAAELLFAALIQLIPLLANIILIYAAIIRIKALWRFHHDKYLLSLMPSALLASFVPLYTITALLVFTALITECWIRLPKPASRGMLFSKEFS